MEEDVRKPMKKKEKQALKHETFIQALATSRSPYSKSHERRLKRKAREQVAGGLHEITAALAEVATDSIPVAVLQSGAVRTADSLTMTPEESSTNRHRKVASGQIGEGRHNPLSKSQRKRALQAERLRIPLILSNPQFSANPFETIRTHAQNTLVKHEGGK
ncbi:ribosome biogenesis protein SLX9-domain-containing protein [Cytidiella melzeri]|nr:ribosome biogenesis protein SLX9-domain-containing protein [Cytidiella melzeri]